MRPMIAVSVLSQASTTLLMGGISPRTPRTNVSITSLVMSYFVSLTTGFSLPISSV